MYVYMYTYVKDIRRSTGQNLQLERDAAREREEKREGGTGGRLRQQRRMTVAIVVPGNPSCRRERCFPGNCLESPRSWWVIAQMQGVAGARMAAPRRHVDSVSLLHVVPHAAARRFACKEQKARPLREAAAGPPSRRAGPGGMVGPFCQTRTGTEANKTVNEIFAFF